MYEDKKKGAVTIDWKSLLIKFAILLVVVFIIVWIASLFKGKDKQIESNLSINLNEFKKTATDYFKGSNLPDTINSKKTVTLGKLIDEKQTIELIDQNGEACSREESYIEATKINETDYTIKVKLVCGKESDYVIDTISYKSITEDNINNEQNDSNDKNTDDSQNSEPDNNDNDNNENNTTNNNINNNTNITNNKPSTSNKPSSNNTIAKPNNTTTINKNVCKLGSLNSNSSYPVAYKITGNCAVTKTELTYGKYANPASEIGIKEYIKLAKEISELSKKSGIELTITTDFYPAINKEGKGYIGYQIKYTVRKKSNDTIVYAYYIDTNFNRKVISDNRNSLSKEKEEVTSITLNKNKLTLNINDSYYLIPTVKGTSTSYNITYSSSDNSIVSVSDSGRITAKKAGNATVTARSGNKSASCYITVQDKTYENGYIVFNFTDATQEVGKKMTIAYTTNMNGTPSWESSNTNVASINSNGEITAKNPGDTIITVTLNGKSATIPLTVKYTKTYYMLTYVNNRGTMTQYIEFNKIPATAKIYALKVEAFNTNSDIDYINYYSDTYSQKEFNVYNGNAKMLSYYFNSYSDIKKYSLKAINYSVKYDKTYHNNNFAIKLTNNINNFDKATKYNNGYLVPVKIMISY